MAGSAPYRHTQTGTLILVVLPVCAALILLLAVLPAGDDSLALSIAVATALLLLAVAFVFRSLTVTVGDGELAWSFGPGVFRRSVPLAAIDRAEPTRTRPYEGWGIHFTTRGWLYNVSGRGAVHLRLTDGKEFLLGTDEPDRLVAAIEDAKRAARAG